MLRILVKHQQSVRDETENVTIGRQEQNNFLVENGLSREETSPVMQESQDKAVVLVILFLEPPNDQSDQSAAKEMDNLMFALCWPGQCCTQAGAAQTWQLSALLLPP